MIPLCQSSGIWKEHCSGKLAEKINHQHCQLRRNAKFPSQRRRKTRGSHGYLSHPYLTGLAQGARRWSLLIIKALGEASRRLAVLVESAIQQWGSKQGIATSACLPGKKVVGREAVFAIVVFACNKKIIHNCQRESSLFRLLNREQKSIGLLDLHLTQAEMFGPATWLLPMSSLCDHPATQERG